MIHYDEEKMKKRSWRSKSGKPREKGFPRNTASRVKIDTLLHNNTGKKKKEIAMG